MIDSTWGKTKLLRDRTRGILPFDTNAPNSSAKAENHCSLFFVQASQGVTKCHLFFLRNIYYWPSDFVSVHKIAKRELGQYPAIFTELAWSIKDLLYGTKKRWKNYLRTCLFSSTEKESSYLQKCWRVSIFSFSSSIPTEKSQKILLSSRKIFLRKKTFVQPLGIWRNFIVGTK